MALMMRMGVYQSLRQQQKIVVPEYDWSMVSAYEKDALHNFVFPLTDTKTQIEGFEDLPHIQKLQLVDDANEIFRYSYVKRKKGSNGGYGYYDEDEDEEVEDDDEGNDAFDYLRIPLIRDLNVEYSDIAEEITEKEYHFAKFVTENVGSMERIARAVPYMELYSEVKKFLNENHDVAIEDVVIVSVDRGGRLPSEILSIALNNNNLHSLKVDQGSERLDIEKLESFVESKIFEDKHVLFVDSTVDSGRQIKALARYFDDEEWLERIGCTGWSVVGSNEYGETLYNHLNVNWGVDPDTTFEDDPSLMGVDYGDSFTKVVEVPSPASKKIREVFFSVPKGTIFDLSNIDINNYCKPKDSEIEDYEFEIPTNLQDQIRALCNIAIADNDLDVCEEDFNTGPLPLSNDLKVSKKKVLLIGASNGDLSENDAVAIADSFDADSCEILTGTERGNPGAIASKISKKWKNFAIRHATNAEEKDKKREEMILNSDVVLVLGGARGSLHETLLSLKHSKPTHLIKGWGYPSNYCSENDWLRNNSNLKISESIRDALSSISSE